MKLVVLYIVKLFINIKSSKHENFGVLLICNKLSQFKYNVKRKESAD